MPDQIAIWRYHAAFSDAPLGIHGTLWVTPSTIPGMLLRDADNSIWFGFKGDAHVLVLSMHSGPLFDPVGTIPVIGATVGGAWASWIERCDRTITPLLAAAISRYPVGDSAGPRLWPLDARGYRKTEAMLDELSRRRMFVHRSTGFFNY